MPTGWSIFLSLSFVLSQWAFAYLVAVVEGRRAAWLLWAWFFAGYPAAVWGLLALAGPYRVRPGSLPAAFYAIVLGHLALGLLLQRIRLRAQRRRFAEVV